MDGVAYFTADDFLSDETSPRDPQFPRVVAFDAHTFKKIRTYPFADTYDSTPLVFQKKNGDWLVIAHEHKNARTVAMNRDTARVEWISPANQPGNLFFGYTYYTQPDGSQLILMASRNGLHAVSGETGEEIWWVKRRSNGGVTPCVDQNNGWVFFQCNRGVLKIRATDGHVLTSATVTPPSDCISWNTVLTDDAHGYFVATYWYGKAEWDSAIRVFDKDLQLVWEKTGLPIGRKATLTYANGKLVSGSGNHWDAKYVGGRWKYVTAYAIATGDVVWKCDLSSQDYQYIANVPYFNGCFYAETQSLDRSTAAKLFRINGDTGRLEEVLTYNRGLCSCAQSIIARGKLFSGDLFTGNGQVVVTKLAENSHLDWPGPFGDPQKNQMSLGDEPGARRVRMREITQ